VIVKRLGTPCGSQEPVMGASLLSPDSPLGEHYA